QFFSKQCGKRINGFSRGAEALLQQYAWPGNLRELRNVIERTVILADAAEIDRLDLPEKLSQGSPLTPVQGVQIGARVSLKEVETEHIARVMKQASTMTEAARILGITRDTLHRKKKEMAGEPEAPVE